MQRPALPSVRLRQGKVLYLNVMSLLRGARSGCGLLRLFFKEEGDFAKSEDGKLQARSFSTWEYICSLLLLWLSTSQR